MGQALAASIDDQSDLLLAGVWRRGGDIDALLENADVVIDFSLPEATAEVLNAWMTRLNVRFRRPGSVCRWSTTAT